VVKIPSSRPVPGPATRVIPTIREIDPQETEPAQSTSTPAVPEHPYASSKDGIHRPPPEPASNQLNNREPLYCTQPPICSKEQVEHTYQRLLDTPVMVTIRDTLTLSPETHARLMDDITSKRVINTRPNERNTMLTEAVNTDPLLFASDSEDHVSVLHLGPTVHQENWTLLL